MSNARFSIIPSRAVHDKELSNPAFKTLCALGLFGDKNGWCFPSLRKLGEILDKSPQAVHKDIKELVKLKYLASHPRYGKDGKERRSNMYQILFDLPYQPQVDTPYQPQVDTLSTTEVDVNVPVNAPDNVVLNCFTCHGQYKFKDLTPFEYQGQQVLRCGSCEILGIESPEQKKTGKAAVIEAARQAISKGAKTQQSMIERVRTSLLLNVEGKRKDYSEFLEFLKARDAEGQSVERFAEYWRTTWQGKTGGVPTLNQVITQWPAAFQSARQNGPTTITSLTPNRPLPKGV